MNASEAAQLLQAQSLVDGRTPSEGAVIVWADALADVPFQQAQDAMRSLWRDSTEYVTPALIRRRMKQLDQAQAVARRRAIAAGRWRETQACGLCDEHGYRLPQGRVVCTHREVRAVGMAERARQEIARTKAIEAGDCRDNETSTA